MKKKLTGNCSSCRYYKTRACSVFKIEGHHPSSDDWCYKYSKKTRSEHNQKGGLFEDTQSEQPS